MYEVTVKKSFAAAHLLKDIGGKCEELHGHNFVVEVSVTAAELNQEGLLIDFRTLKKWTDEILVKLDHKHLNNTPPFKNMNPSSENIARFIYDGITEKASRERIAVSRVTVWESDNARVSYSGTAQ
ncbi:MAG: 6-carboxytetrahydropterin synthase QueD [Deltaproteobacteria bacterium]|jgi:6-pyruvoyltetrahydropterin/6-carboxytetrahydropterin synthase|nr:6-carboxytetrahydropterin synthase QueD [Deltaproteobacteria bacterium]